MFAAQQTLAFFPTYVWVFDLPEDEARHLNETILGRLVAGGSAVPERDEHFQQTQTDLQNREGFQKLNEFALSAATEISDFLKIEYDAFEVTRCWINIGPIGAAHREHSHPNNFLGGAYNTRARRPAGTPSPSAIRGFRRTSSRRTSASRARVRQAASMWACGTAGWCCFRVWLRHWVPSNRGDRQRVSVAINVMFTDYVARMSRPRWSGAVQI